jgi:hypothetical protein
MEPRAPGNTLSNEEIAYTENEMTTKTDLLNMLADALQSVTDDHYGRPTVYEADVDHAGTGTEILAWDGPYDWTMITARSSVYAGEQGAYSRPLEPQIAEVLDNIEETHGFMLEPVNNSWLAIFPR